MLTENWLVDGLSDFEYKKYLFLAFLQRNSEALNEQKLYPALSELIQQHQYLNEVKNKKELFQSQFPKHLKGIEMKRFKLLYENREQDSSEIEVVNALIDFALPKVEGNIKLGKEIYNEAEKSIEINQIGVEPLRKHEGLLFLKNKIDRVIHLYQYHLSAIELAGEAYRSIRITHLASFVKKLSETFESMKLFWMKELKMNIIPATYLLEYDKLYPFDETMLPVSKRKVMKYLKVNS